MGERKPFPSMTDKEVAHVIGVAISHGKSDPRVNISKDYQFDITTFRDVDINQDSINCIYESAIQFNGTASADQIDPVSKVTSKVRLSIGGTAFFAKDIANDTCLMRVSLQNIKIINQF